MGSPFRQRSALKHDILDNNSQPWEHKHSNGRIRGTQNVVSPVVNDPGYLENQRFGNRNVFSSAGDGTKINANDQQLNQSTQIADLYNSGRLNPEGFNTQASYRKRNKIDGDFSLKNNKLKVKFPGSSKNIPNWMNNTRNVNFYDGDEADLTAPSTQYTPEQINSILSETGTASFVSDGNGGFTFESGGGGNTFNEEVAFKGDYKDDSAMPEGYTLQPPESIDAIRARILAEKTNGSKPTATIEERKAILEQKRAEILAKKANEVGQEEATMEERKAILDQKRLKILAERANKLGQTPNAPQQTGMPRPITTRNRY